MEFQHVDVFAEAAYSGNPLAVFPDATGLTKKQMQAIATELNLSETSFVIAADEDSYRVRIFTPRSELPFAGHPTVGTCWVLRHLGVITGDEAVQTSAAGETAVRIEGERVWFSRPGSSDADLDASDRAVAGKIAKALGLEERDVGLEAREIGRSGMLRPAFADAGLKQLMVPLRDLGALARCVPRADLLADLTDIGAYCFSAVRAGAIQARGFWPALGVAEDPATGSAAAALGAYLVDRLEPIGLDIRQGIEMGRPSLLHLKAAPGKVEVGGECRSIFKAELETLP